MLKYSENPYPRQVQDRFSPGWLCIIGVSLIFIFNVSLISSFGMMFEPFFQGDSSATFMNLFQFLSNLTILTTGFLLKDLSSKSFVIIGSSMIFLGLLLSSFVTSTTQLLFTFPVLIGIGIGMLNPAAFVAVLSCFTCKRVIAISLGFASLKWGQSIMMPALVKTFIENFGHTITMRIICILSLMGFIGGTLLAPVKWRPSVIHMARHDEESQPLIIKNLVKGTVFIREVVAGADLDLLCNLKYVVILFGLTVVYASSVNLDIIFPIYLQKNNFDSIQINDCVFTISIVDVITRVSYPMIHSRLKLTSRTIFLMGISGLGIIRMILIHTNLNSEFYYIVILLCVGIGFFRAITVINQVLVLIDFCEENCPSKLPGVLGLSVVIKAALLYFFSWMFNEIRKVQPPLIMNFYAHTILFVIVIILWVLEDEPLMN